MKKRYSGKIIGETVEIEIRWCRSQRGRFLHIRNADASHYGIQSFCGVNARGLEGYWQEPNPLLSPLPKCKKCLTVARRSRNILTVEEFTEMVRYEKEKLKSDVRELLASSHLRWSLDDGDFFDYYKNNIAIDLICAILYDFQENVALVVVEREGCGIKSAPSDLKPGAYYLIRP